MQTESCEDIVEYELLAFLDEAIDKLRVNPLIYDESSPIWQEYHTALRIRHAVRSILDYYKEREVDYDDRH